MKFQKKKICGILTAIAVMFSGISMSSISMNMYQAQAATRTQVNAKISSLESQIQQLKTKKKGEVANEKKKLAGTTSLLGAEIISHNPFVAYDSLSRSYYWINNPDQLVLSFISAMGYIKLTGQYRTYNGYTCAVCNAVKVKITSTETQKKIDAKKHKVRRYKRSLKEKAILKNAKIKVGKKAKIQRMWRYGGAYNTLKWKSSNKRIATVDGHGNVTAKKAGTVVISAKASVSGITSKCKVTVYKPEKKPDKKQPSDSEDYGYSSEYGGMSFQNESYEYSNRELEIDGRRIVILLYMPSEDWDTVSIYSSDEDVVEYLSGEPIDVDAISVNFYANGTGTSEITARTDTGLTAHCKITCYD